MNEEQILLYDFYHASVKSSLIQHITNEPTQKFCQIGCGKYDIHLWDRYHVSKITFVDNNPYLLKLLEERCKHKKEVRFDVQQNLKFEKDSYHHVFIPDMNRFCTNHDTLNELFMTLSESVVHGGYVVGTLLDLEQIQYILNYQHFYKNTYGFIKTLFFDHSKIGNSVKIGLPNKLYLQERTVEIYYLATKEYICNVAKANGFETVFTKSYKDYSHKCKVYLEQDYLDYLYLFTSIMFKKIN